MTEEFTVAPLQDEFTVAPLKEEFTVAPVAKQPKRVSDPGKQALAGVTDIGTGLPIIAGLAGAGLEAGWNTLTNEGEQSFKDNFTTAMKEGTDADLIGFGSRGRQQVNDFFDIKDPVSTEDQLARLAGGFLPIPGGALAANAGKLAKIGLGTAQLALPIVKSGSKAQFARRGAAQLGIGIGADQGIRAIEDSAQRPLVFSDVALAGQGAQEFTVAPVIPPVEVNADVIEGNSEGLLFLKDLDRRVQNEQDWEDTKFWMIVAGSVIAGGAALKWARNGRTDTAWQQTKDVGNYVFSRTMDKSQHLDDALKDVNFSESARKKVVSGSHTDVADIGDNFRHTGRLGQGYVLPAHMEVHAPVKLEAERLSLAENTKVFDEAMVAQSQRATIQNTKESVTRLWRAGQAKIPDLDASIKVARDIPAVKALMDKYAKTYEVLLDYQKFRGVLTEKEVTKLTERATLKDVPGGRLTYMPLYAKTKRQFFRNLSRNYLGMETKQGRIANTIEELGSRDINISAPDTLFSPVKALERYSLSAIQHANEQSFKGGVLDALSLITRDRVGDPTRIVGRTPARDTTYIGRATDLEDINRLHVDIHAADPYVKNKFKSGALNDLRAAHGDAIKTVHQNGEMRVYYVPDKGLQAAVELSPQLGPMLKTLSNWKSMFTQLTTGEFSTFAPISGLFSTQQIAFNTAMTEGLFKGVQSVGQSFKGTKKLMAENGAGAIARYLDKRIARTIGEGRVPEKATVGRQAALERKFLDATMNQVRTETGRTVTSAGNIGNGTIEEVLERVGQNSTDFFGKDQIGLVKELWSSWNAAWFEGPAYGAMLKHIDEAVASGRTLDATLTREAVDISKDVAGDMRRIGSSGFAKAFNASVPFSGAMLQSWNSIGHAFSLAAKNNNYKYMAGATALVGVPTLSELAYNGIISAASGTFPDASGKEWTYDDYYWNGYTTQQRADNFIYFVPGQPPWEAILVPVSPEWSLFRATTMEAADAVFGLSAVGNMGKDVVGNLQVDQIKTNRSMFLHSLRRVFDVPLPPLLSASASALGVDVQLGFAHEIQTDPDNPGSSTSILRTNPIGQGDRITRKSGKSRFAQGDLDRKMAAVIQDIFGAAGSAYINVYEAAMAGSRGREGTIGKGFSNAVDAFGQSLKQQARYLQPLFGKTLRPNANDEIAKTLFVSRDNLKKMTTQMNNGFIGGGVAFSDGQIVQGEVPVPDDPIYLELAASATTINSNIGQLDKSITALRRNISTASNAVNLGSQRQKNDKIDGWNLEIQAIKAQQLAVIHDFEEKLSDHLSSPSQYDRRIEVDLTSVTPRPDATEGLSLRGFLKSPRTSQ